jgi:hypothetical protein
MGQKIRRVVTGHNEQGQSAAIYDGYATNVKEMLPGLFTTELWVTRTTPADNSGNEDAADTFPRLEPPPTGTAFRVVEFPPEASWRNSPDAREKAKKGWETIAGAHAQDKGSNNPMMHKTPSVDYAIVLKGEIWAVLDTGEVCLKPGDTLIQRGTNHAWSVRTDEPSLVAFILVGADPV